MEDQAAQPTRTYPNRELFFSLAARLGLRSTHRMRVAGGGCSSSFGSAEACALRKRNYESAQGAKGPTYITLARPFSWPCSRTSKRRVVKHAGHRRAAAA